MRTSAFEIRSTVQKAALGCGLETGLAIDVGLAAEWLSLQGFDGVSAALAAISTKGQPIPELTASNGVVRVEKPQIGRCGASFMVYWRSSQTSNKCSLTTPTARC